MKGLDCERENETHCKLDFEGWICCTCRVGAVPLLSVCSRQAKEGTRSVFENSVEMVSAHEVNSVKMMVWQLVVQQKMMNHIGTLKPPCRTAVLSSAGNRSCLVSCGGQTSVLFSSDS